VEGVPNTCSATSSPASRHATADWSSWGVDTSNSRFQTADAAGLSAAQVPRLKLKWAFHLGADAETRSQPAIVNETVYVGAVKLYALDEQSGCTRWVFAPPAPVRSGLMVGASPGQETAVFFGDYQSNIYAVSAATGKLLWKTHTDPYFAAMSTGTPVLYEGVIYLGLSSFEEVMAASPKYPCCGFRGSVVALNAATGAQIWKTYTIDAAPQPIAGTTFRGPSGAGIWSSPTIDEKLHRLYVGTGDNYSEPSTATSDAVLALDLATGKLLWSRQVTTGDIYNVGCDPGVHGACPETHGKDYDFGAPPILMTLNAGKRALVIGQKSGLVYAFDPDADGKPMWSTRVGEGGALGGVQWGSAATDGRVYVALSDLRLTGVPDKNEKQGYRLEADGTKGGGLFAIDAATGKSCLERQAGDVRRAETM
jgi:polyvinyl alcohol dehydrogenase (cytochrome)